jgi:hypothetical protein
MEVGDMGGNCYDLTITVPTGSHVEYSSVESGTAHTPNYMATSGSTRPTSRP